MTTCPVPARARAAALAAALALGPGCSWITVTRPPAGPVSREEKLACTTSVVAPVVDTVLGSAALLAGATGLGVGIAGLSCGDPTACWFAQPVGGAYAAVGTVLLGVAVMQGFSAAYGFGATAECRVLEENQLACLSGVEPSCARLGARGQAGGR
jgi:hypothetical protein